MNTSDPDIARWKFIAKHTPNQTQPVIVDVGANPLENPPFKKLVETGLCRVHGFEPQAQAFARLQETKGPNEDYENCAVGDGRTHPFHVYRQSGLSSIFSLDRSAMQFLGRPDRPAQLLDHFAVKTKRLNDVNLAGDLDLLKIDAQGAETMIFDHGTDKLQNAVAVITELRFYPLYVGEPLLDSQIKKLDELGLRFHKFLFVKSQQVANSQSARLRRRMVRSQALDGDAVFIRDLRDPQAVTEHQLWSLALLADAVFGSYDLTVHCLDLLVAHHNLDPVAPQTYVDHLPMHLRSDG